MDRTETIARGFLAVLGHPNVTYEPDGNVPPDFLTSDGTAIEVRRLNQLHVDSQGKVQGLETADIALWRTMTALINGHQSTASTNTTYGVLYHFVRPIPSKSTLTRELSSELEAFLAAGRQATRRVTLPCGVRLTIFDWKMWKGTPFRLAGSMDEQSGGFVVGNLATAISYALLDKDSKIASYKAKYSRWWLVLMDHVSFGTDEHDRRQLRDYGPFTSSFDKVFIVNPQNIQDYFEL